MPKISQKGEKEKKKNMDEIFILISLEHKFSISIDIKLPRKKCEKINVEKRKIHSLR